MIKKRFKEYQPNQLIAITALYKRYWLPEDHPVHFIREVVNNLDLSTIYNNYRERCGQPPYEPKMMVGVFIYAYLCRYERYILIQKDRESSI